jgi:hypothetical protein
MWTDGQTHMMKQTVAFRNIAKEPIKNERVLYLYHIRSRRHTHTMTKRKCNERIT